MKKRLKILTYPALFVLLFIVALNIKINIQQNQFSSINFQNIETLSYAEASSSRCYGTGSVDCSNSKEKVSYVLD